MRESKLMDAKDAVSRFVEEVAFLAVGGMHMHNNTMALIREVIRQGKKIGTLTMSPSGSVNVDLLIGSGLVSEVLSCYVGFEHLGLAPNFRKFVESKSVKLRDVDEGYIVYGFSAGASSLPFMPFPPGMEYDHPKVNPEDYKFVKDPFTGEEVLCAKAIQPDVAFVHCQKADEFGNGIFEGSVFTDFEMLKASDKVIIQAEEVVPTEYMVKHSTRTMVPSFLVDAVVHIPFGCHPASSHNYYTYDEEHLKKYLEMAKKDFSAYLKEFIFECKGNDDYLEKIGGRAKIKELMRAPEVL